jgi:polar amino acid transport system substrate-binding protein
MKRCLVLLALVSSLAACGGSDSESDQAASAADSDGDPRTDKLAQVLARGTLVLSTDLEYPPQSYEVKKAKRLANTKCSANQRTAPEVAGYDAETGKRVAEALGVESCFVTPTWTEITGGNWGDRWDVAWGSGAINGDRMTRLYMTQPYYADQQRFFVRKDSPIKDPHELSGKKVGACAACTHELYLRHTLEVPGVEISFFLEDPEVVIFDVETGGLKAVAQGKIDAFICASPVGENAIDEGLPLRALSPSPFRLYSTGFVDKSSGLAVGPFVKRVNQIIDRLHADGTMKRLSLKYFGKDYATQAADFDLASIGQQVR